MSQRTLRFLVTGLLFFGLHSAKASPGEASVVYGIQASSGNILTIDPLTGAVLNSYATPAAIPVNDPNAGLTYAATLNELLYFNQSQSTTLFRLNPDTGAVKGSALGDTFPNSGLSFEHSAAVSQDFLFYAHQGVDLHRQSAIGGGTVFFWATGVPSAGLGGDGYGREFGIFDDGMIHEYDPFVDTDAFINGFGSPAGALGFAFDGSRLYVSTTTGLLLTLNPNTGAVLNSVSVAGGNLIELGAKSIGVPEPASLLLLASGLAGLAGVTWRRHRRT